LVAEAPEVVEDSGGRGAAKDSRPPSLSSTCRGYLDTLVKSRIATVAMKINCRIPHIENVEVPRAHVMRLTFDDGLVRELEFVSGSSRGTVFAALDDPEYFAHVWVDPESRTVTWPNGSMALGVWLALAFAHAPSRSL